MKAKLLALVIAIVPLFVAAELVGGAQESDASLPSNPPPPVRSDVDPGRFGEFVLYSVGRSFEGLPLKAIVRRKDTPIPSEPVRANFVSFLYGECAAFSDVGCAPPLEVQIWPACERTIADYSLTPAGDPLPHEKRVVRGVPAAVFEDGLRLKLYTGRVTVVIFRLDEARISRAAAALRGENNPVAPEKPLPEPAAGAMAGGPC